MYRKYKLLRDLPFADKGKIFYFYDDDENIIYYFEFKKSDIKDFFKWFKEFKGKGTITKSADTSKIGYSFFDTDDVDLKNTKAKYKINKGDKKCRNSLKS
jgi:hypothetical protein